MSHALNQFVSHYGYWTVAIALLLENAGIPAPGETILLVAGFLARTRGEMQLPYVVLVATLAATLGDNLGYWIGRRGGRPLIARWRWLSELHGDGLAKGERLFARYGPATIFFSRFIFGMRIIAGPLAGALRMPWKRFTLFNFLGAAVWTSVVASCGFLLAGHWRRALRVMGSLEFILLAILAVCVVLVWRFRDRDA